MAECKNCVHNKVCAEVNSLKCRKDFIWYDAKYGCPYYSADFVPKSEVERLEHILDCYALQYGTVTEQREVIDKAKAEVVRDIFEEIEAEITAALKNNYARRNECNAETDLSHTANISGKIACLRGLADFVDKLKKKYTGE